MRVHRPTIRTLRDRRVAEHRGVPADTASAAIDDPGLADRGIEAQRTEG